MAAHAPLRAASAWAMRPALPLVAALLLGLAACAAPAVTDGPQVLADPARLAPPAPPRPSVVAATARMPARLALVFERAGEARSDGMTGMMVRYNLGQTGAWATVFLYDEGEASIPPGVDSAVLRQVLAQNVAVARGNADGGAVRTFAVPGSGAPAQACVAGQALWEGRTVANYACATGAGNVILKVRVTAPLPPGDAAQQGLVDRLVAGLVADATRVVAGHPPLSLGNPAAPPQAAAPRRLPDRATRL